VLSSEQRHLVQGCFDVDRMMSTLEDALDQALTDGYEGLWATGDMSWEIGPQKDFSKLLEYEWRLEEFFRKHPALGGICQYHADTLPREVLRQGLLTHPSIFINETLSQVNPHYLRADSYIDHAAVNPDLESAINRLYPGKGTN
jgi:MEDS: MEthanogen/methylotroph, DcmR Sensory domain